MKVSIVVTVYNREKFIARCLRSCLDQSMNKKDYEIIVVNDGSTDNSEEVINSFGNKVRKISYKKNKGLAFASNTGIEAANSKYIVRIDSDDYVHTDLIKIEYDFMEMNHYDAVSCDYLIVDSKERVITRENGFKKPIACGIMFNKDRLIEIGLYDTQFRLMEDIDLRARFEEKFEIYNLEIPLYRYLMHESNATKNVENVERYTKLFKKKHEEK